MRIKIKLIKRAEIINICNKTGGERKRESKQFFVLNVINNVSLSGI